MEVVAQPAIVEETKENVECEVKDLSTLPKQESDASTATNDSVVSEAQAVPASEAIQNASQEIKQV